MLRILNFIAVLAEIAFRVLIWTTVGIGGDAVALPLKSSQLSGLAVGVITPAGFVYRQLISKELLVYIVLPNV
jgi:hypothetical protein